MVTGTTRRRGRSHRFFFPARGRRAAAAATGLGLAALCLGPAPLAHAASTCTVTRTAVAGMPNTVELRVTGDGTCTATLPSGVVKAEAILVGSGGGSMNMFAGSAGGGGQVKHASLATTAGTLRFSLGASSSCRSGNSPDPSSPPSLSGAETTLTQGGATVTAAGGRAALTDADGACGGTSGGGQPGECSWEFDGHGGGGAGGAASGANGGAGVAVRALAGAGSLFAGVTDCYGGGAAMTGTATCGGGTNAADGTPIIPANTGGGASAHRGMIVSLTPMGTTASERRALNKAAFDQAKASATGGNGVVRGQAASDPLPGSSGLIRVRYALPNTTTVHVQIDRYPWRSASTARRVAALDDDGLLKYREDRFMWGRSRWQTVTVQVPAKLHAGSARRGGEREEHAGADHVDGSDRDAAVPRDGAHRLEARRGGHPGQAVGPRTNISEVYLGQGR